jgi:hypothetical protein
MTKEEQIIDLGVDDVKVLRNYNYEDALVGVTIDGVAVYDYNKMIKWLVEKEGLEELEAIEWIDYNTIRALPYFGEKAPIIMYSLEE